MLTDAKNTNKLMIGITTAGDDMTSFCYKRLQMCVRILELERRLAQIDADAHFMHQLHGRDVTHFLFSGSTADAEQTAQHGGCAEHRRHFFHNHRNSPLVNFFLQKMKISPHFSLYHRRAEKEMAVSAFFYSNNGIYHAEKA